MILCLCRGVSDREIVEAIRRGARDLHEVAVVCAGAGSGCGACRASIEEFLGEPRCQQPTA
jgi:bacterioferritin-associated ferredoxin